MENVTGVREMLFRELARQDTPGLQKAMALCEDLPVPGQAEDALCLECLFQAGLTAERLKQWEPAVSLYSRALEYAGGAACDTIANLEYRLAVCLTFRSQPETALAYYRSSLAHTSGSSPLAPLARYGLGCLLMSAGNHAEAANHLRLLVESDTDAGPLCGFELRLRWLNCLLREGQTEPESLLAISARLQRAEGTMDISLLHLLHETAFAAESAGQYQLAAVLYTRLLECREAPPLFAANGSLRLGLTLEYLGRPMEAVALYRNAIRFSEDSPQVRALARFHLANLLMASEEYEEAASLYGELCQDASTVLVPLAQLWLRQAECLLCAGNATRAEEILQSIRGAVDHALLPKIEQLFATIYEHRKDFRSAAACYERIIQHPFTDAPLKNAALHRLNLLQERRMY